MRIPSELPRRLPHASRRFRIGVLVAIVVLILVLLSVRSVARFWTDYLWFQNVGYTSVFRGVLVTKVLLATVFTVIFFFLLLGNLVLADRMAPPVVAVGPEDELVSRYREVVGPHRRAVQVVTALIFGLFSGVGTSSEWNNWDLFRYHLGFGVKDPQYGRDVGFYVFQLPFIRFLLSWLFLSVIVTLIVTVVAHYLNGGIRFQGQGPRVTSAVKTHVSVLLGVLALIKGVDYYFQRLELVLSSKHVVDGATATSIHADQPAKTLLIAIAVIAAGLFLYNIRQKGWTLPIVAVALWALVWVLVGGVYPALYQAVRVAPSEFTREKQYIARNINATQVAYGINDVQVTQNYQANAVVNPSQITGDAAQAQANQQTIANIRLLDPGQLTHTFDKFQALRTYFSFNNLNPDRYALPAGGAPQMTQTITAVRELNNQVPSGFVNQHLVYTHGYGAVVVPWGPAGVNPDGTPNFSLQDIPPTGVPPLNSTPQVYFGVGQETGGYVVGHTKQPELDYENASGAQVQTSYAGNGGVNAGGFFRRVAFALRFGDPNIVLSGQITSDSRIMYIRNIGDRVRKAAPFLKFDSDPYAVIVNGRTYWVQDAYTTTSQYPYSQHADTTRVPAGSGLSGSFNYVRNSVKVVIDAYDGSMHFFVMNTNDPIIKVYERAFPDLLTPVSKAERIIPGITSHWRYPEDLFRVETNMFGRYHLNDPSEFYNQGFAWTTSQDPGSGPLNQVPLGQPVLNAAGQPVAVQSARLQPQYLLAHLPSSTQQSFMILQPFVPVSPSDKQQNLTAFMTGSADPSDYGTLRVYETPPNVSVDGPALINNAIRSNNVISTELTLLGQGGSQVELGQVALVPIDQTLLYVEPIYVESSSNQVPTLKDVVVVYNGTAYNSGNASLDAALCKLTNADGTKPFGQYCQTSAANNPTTVPAPAGGGGAGGGGGGSTTTTVPGGPAAASVQQLLAQAQQAFAAATQALKSGDLAGYQKDVNLAAQEVAQAEQLAAGAPVSGSPPTTGSPGATTPPTTAPGH
ncbi:MAG: UPF0182 family protein [Acidimicrobiales bacterium]